MQPKKKMSEKYSMASDAGQWIPGPNPKPYFLLLAIFS